MVRDEEDRPLARHVVEPRHLDAAIEQIDEETDEPGDGAIHARWGAASALGNRTLKKAPIAKTRTTKSTEIPAR